MASSIRVAILSDDRLFAEGLARILGGEPSYAVVENAGEDPSPLRRPAGGPQVLIVDGRIEGALGVCASRRSRAFPAVVFVSAPEGEAWAQEALAVGARGILSRRAGSADLLQAVRVVHEGGIWAPRRLLAECIARLTRPAAARPGRDVQLAYRLSTREREIFRHAATGLSNKELADRLAISRATVKAHLTQIFQKLGVNGRAQLAAAYHGILATGRPVAADGMPPVVRLKA